MLDDELLSAIQAAAALLEEEVEDGGETIVLKAVIVFAYLNQHGEVQWGYRRVKADWFDIGGAAAMLSAAYQTIWLREGGFGDAD